MQSHRLSQLSIISMYTHTHQRHIQLASATNFYKCREQFTYSHVAGNLILPTHTTLGNIESLEENMLNVVKFWRIIKNWGPTQNSLKHVNTRNT